MKTMIFAMVIAAMLTPAVALAQATATSSIGSNAASASQTNVATAFEGTVVSTRKDGKICRKKTETGSRLGGHTDCRSKAEWDEMAKNAREDTALHQQRGIVDRK